MNTEKRSYKSIKANQVATNLPGVEKTFILHNNKRPTSDVDYPLRCVYPLLTKTVKGMIMTSYKLYISKYNSTAKDVNRKVISKQIWAAKEHLANHADPKIILKEQRNFQSNYGDLPVWTYNKKVDQYNNKKGNPVIQKRKVQTVKQATEKIFHTIIWVYSDQLQKMRRKKGSMEHKTGAYTKEVYKVDINTKHLLNAKDQFGMYMMDVCQDTCLNHKKRLIEAGVLLNNQYRGWEKGTMHHINPEIMVVFDDHDGKIQFSENQLFMNERPEVFRVVDIPTRTISKTQIKRDGEEPSLIGKKDAKAIEETADLPPVFLSVQYPTDISTRPPGSKMKNPKLPEPDNTPPRKKEKGSAKKESSAKLWEMIEYPKEFTDQLSNGDFLGAASLPYEALQREAQEGTLDRTEFRQLLLQDLFKQFSKLYKDHPHFRKIFPKVWYNAYKNWEEGQVLINRNGDTLHKDKCLLAYQKILYVIINKTFGALHVSRRTKFAFPAPTIYLNLSNDTPGTFLYYYKKVEKNSIEAIEKKLEREKEMRRKGKNSIIYANALRKLNDKLALFYNGRISDEELFRYIDENMPKAVREDFHKHFTNYINNKTA